MKFYNIYAPKDGALDYEKIKIIKEGWSWLSMIFSFFWALYQKLWLLAFGLFALDLVFDKLVKLNMLPEYKIMVIKIGILIWLGFSANDLRAKKLEKKGYKLQDIIYANNEISAYQIFLTRQVI